VPAWEFNSDEQDNFWPHGTYDLEKDFKPIINYDTNVRRHTEKIL
jgi:hypothetical protein